MKLIYILSVSVFLLVGGCASSVVDKGNIDRPTAYAARVLPAEVKREARPADGPGHFMWSDGVVRDQPEFTHLTMLAQTPTDGPAVHSGVAQPVGVVVQNQAPVVLVNNYPSAQVGANGQLVWTQPMEPVRVQVVQESTYLKRPASVPWGGGYNQFGDYYSGGSSFSAGASAGATVSFGTNGNDWRYNRGPEFYQEWYGGDTTYWENTHNNHGHGKPWTAPGQNNKNCK